MADFFTKTAAAKPVQPARGDPLPLSARTKLLALEGAATDARDAALSAARRVGDLQRALALNANPEDAPSLEHELSRLRAVRGQQDHRHRELAALTVGIQQWLRSLSPSVVLEGARPSAAKALTGETLLQAIGRVRDEITAAQQHMKVVQAAPLPKADLKRQARAYVQAMVQRGAPQVSAEAGINFKDPHSMVSVSLDHLTAIMAWANPEQLTNRLEAVIDAMPEPALALTAAEKETRTAALTRSIEQLERQEEALIETAIAAGSTILRRPRASPLAVLGVAIKAQRTEAAA